MKLTRMFEWVGFYTNLGKTKSMMCTPGFIWGNLGNDYYKRQAMGKGATFRERKTTGGIYDNCGIIMA